MNHNGRRLFITLVLALLLTCVVSAALAVSGTVNVSSLVLREDMSTKSDALQTLSKGEEVEIIHKNGSWYKIKYGRYTGYVMARYVTAKGSVPTVDEPKTLREGDRGAEVKAMQKRLKELGYLTGSADGVFGPMTTEAVKAFQKRNGLTADGVVGPATLAKLNSSSAKAASSSASSGTSSSTSTADTDTTLRSGSRGQAVKDLQKRLKTLGYYSGSIDGVYGTGTIKAVRAFQERNRLTVDGVAGPSTLKQLYSSSAKSARDDADDDDDQDVDDGVLRKGSRGQAVRTLQKKLKDLGYYTGSVDGAYGDATIAAVRAFQARNKLTVDGAAGTSTLKVLYSSSAKPAEAKDEPVEVEGDELRAGAYGPEVRALQTRLKALGYYKGGIDGSYGTQTVAAVKAFQSRNNITVDGVAGASTLARLNSSSAIPAEDKVDDKDDDDDDGILRPGDKGTEVKEMQYRLKELGYYAGSRDGVYGASTRTAVMAFQTRNGLTPDGIAGPATLTKLYSSSALPATSGSAGNTGGTTGGSTGGNSGSSSGTTTVTLKTNQTLRPGDDNEQVAAMQTRLKELGYYSNSVDGDYDYATRQAVLTFQRNNGLTQDGIAGESTLKKMVSSSAVSASAASSTKYVTERLDWFNGGASRIPRGAIFQVKDVRTGLVFKAKRQGGSNHLDAEPLTAADSAILLKINGGVEYSWRRRPMLVLYNGRVYACSIYSEPHGDDTISSNDYDGQFCLHFYGSKTHGTDRVDEDHQKCEAQALKATW